MEIKSILFVCLGNICRSPLAEGIAKNYIKEKNLDLIIESAGTGHWHVGEKPAILQKSSFAYKIIPFSSASDTIIISFDRTISFSILYPFGFISYRNILARNSTKMVS